MTDWKSDKAEGEMRRHDAERVKKLKEANLKLEAETREKEWLELYEKCKHITDSPSMTKAVFRWFIENNYNAPKQP